jgi:hypothetical protein
MIEKIKAFAKLLEKEQLRRMATEFPGHPENCLKMDYTVHIKPGRKYTKVDLGTSGKYMIDKDENIWGIKTYGKVHLGHNYGTLGTIKDWDWSQFYGRRK